MRKLRSIAAALLLTALAAAGCAQPGRSGAGWVTLFDGRHFDNFTLVGDANWRIVEGLAQADAGNGYLVSKQSYRDFELRADVWVDESANSGILIRIQDAANITPWTSYEVNLFDRTPNAGYGTGSIVGFAKVERRREAGGNWSTLLISAKGSHLVVRLNGAETANIHDAKFAAGPFALQRAAGVVKFRKVEVRPL